MVDLIAKTPCEGLLPKTHGSVRMEEVVPDGMVSLAPYAGREADVASALDGLGLGLPKVGRSQSKAGAEIVWFSRGEAMLLDAHPPEGLEKSAAVTEQGDAWAVVSLSGPDADAVLARLVPIDLRQSTFKRGHAARTLLGHLNVHITRTGNETFRIMAFRSMAKTLVHELERAMQAVAARR